MVFAPRKGSEAAKKAIDSARGRRGPRIEYFKLEDNEQVTLRFLVDEAEWVFVDEHSYVPTREPVGLSDEDKKKWPSRMGAVCRHDEAFQGEFADCFICDELHKETVNDSRKDGRWGTSVTYYVPALVREEVRATQEMIDEGLVPAKTPRGASMLGKLIGWDDAVVEDDELDADDKPTGKKINRKRVILICQKQKNFFGPLGGFAAMSDEGTILDRDFTVKREGIGTATEYRFSGRDPVKDADGNTWDMRDAEPLLDDQGNQVVKDGEPQFTERTLGEAYASQIDIETLIKGKASDDYYERFFDTRVPFPTREKKEDENDTKGKKGESKPDAAPKGAPAEQQTKPAEAGATAEQMAAMRQRLSRATRGQRVEEPAEDGEMAPAGS